MKLPDIDMKWIKPTYFYLVSIITIVIFIVGAIGIINMSLKRYVFNVTEYHRPTIVCEPGGDCKKPSDEEITQQERDQFARDMSQFLAMLLVSAPIFLFHFKQAKKSV